MIDDLAPALLIFALRMADMTLYTLRIMMVVRGRKAWAWMFAFFQSTLYIIAIRAVLSDLGNPLKLLGYAAGFASGLVVGMLIESRLALGHLLLRIVSARHGLEIAGQLRAAGYAVTEIPARGRDGMVSLLLCNVRRRQLAEVRRVVSGLDAEAFITEQTMHPVQRGFWRA